MKLVHANYHQKMANNLIMVKTMNTDLTKSDLVFLLLSNAIALHILLAISTELEQSDIFSGVVKFIFFSYAFWYISAIIASYISKHTPINYKRLAGNHLLAETLMYYHAS